MTDFNTGKPWLKSKTNRFAIILAGFGIAILTLPQVKELIELAPAEYQGIAAIIVSAAVMYLRHLTGQPLTTAAKGKFQ